VLKTIPLEISLSDIIDNRFSSKFVRHHTCSWIFTSRRCPWHSTCIANSLLRAPRKDVTINLAT